MAENIVMKINYDPSLQSLSKAMNNVADSKVLHDELARLSYEAEAASKKVSPVKTGRMRASIFTILDNLKASIGPTVNYAPFVHFGTRRMRARPFLQWGIDAAIIKLYASAKPPFSWAIDREFQKEFSKL